MKKFVIFLSFIGFSPFSALAQLKIEDLEQLKNLQTKVKSVVEKNMPATVSIMTGKGASGSGVIVSKEGLILTAAHVIRGAKQVDIIFPNGKAAKAEVLGANFSKDTAICKMVKPGPWKFVEMAESKDLKIGQFVVGMGHAAGFDPVRTPPVRFGRVLSKNTNYFVTTDCTLIGGDSGGPLYDLQGRVVGIHSNIGNTWSTNNHAGLTGFKLEWDRLMKGEQWGTLSINPMTNPDSPAIGIKMGRSILGGVEVAEVLPEGPSDKAGIKDGDVILKVQDKEVKSSETLLGAIMSHNAGDKIKLKLLRKGKDLELNLTLGRREELNKFEP